jgi:hypothetical protein
LRAPSGSSCKLDPSAPQNKPSNSQQLPQGPKFRTSAKCTVGECEGSWAPELPSKSAHGRSQVALQSVEMAVQQPGKLAGLYLQCASSGLAISALTGTPIRDEKIYIGPISVSVCAISQTDQPWPIYRASPRLHGRVL